MSEIKKSKKKTKSIPSSELDSPPETSSPENSLDNSSKEFKRVRTAGQNHNPSFLCQCCFCTLFILLIIPIIYYFIKMKKKIQLFSFTTDYSDIPTNTSCIPDQNLFRFKSEKWVVVTTINAPTPSIHELLKLPEPWKIVIIGDSKSKDEPWEEFKTSNKLIFLSVKSQENLCYNMTKYIPTKSYTRKNIGYLYAIQNGAKEIYETDDDNQFIKSFNDYNFNNNSFISYAKSDPKIMINPYSYFGQPTIWPRGYRLSDIGKNNKNNFYYTITNKIYNNPLIYQGVANGDPDVDAIFRLTRAKTNKKINITFYDMENLLYFPGNYIPTNSQNTRFNYKVFPALCLPTTVAFRVCDIWRGYLIERFAWGYNGTTMFHSATVYQDRNIHDYYLDYVDEYDLYYSLDKLLEVLNTELEVKNDPELFMIKIIQCLVLKGILKKNDYFMYKAYLKDLKNVGYKFEKGFSEKIYGYENQINEKPKIQFYIPSSEKIMLQDQNERGSLTKHYIPKKYNNILLIINHQKEGLEKYNDFISNEIYKNYFDNIVFVTSSNNENQNMISCPESKNGEFSYICLKKIHEKYSSMNGYIFINSDTLLKVWELDNLNFNIPWFSTIFKKTLIDNENEKNIINGLVELLKNKPDYETNLKKFIEGNGYIKGTSDFYYLPNDKIKKFLEIIDEMYKNNISSDVAVINALAIMMEEEYVAFEVKPLCNEEKKNVMYHLKNDHDQIFIRPFDIENEEVRSQLKNYMLTHTVGSY